MRNFLVLWRKELATYFISMAAYITTVVVLIVTGLDFSFRAMLSRGEPLQLDDLSWLPTLWVMVLMVATILTMRLFAEEKRSGTIESLMTAPVTETEVVLGKYAAALTVFVVIFAPTASHIFILRRFSSGVASIDILAVACGYLMLLLIGAFYVSIGLLLSSLSRSQIVSAVSCFAVLCVLFLLVSSLDQLVRDQAVTALQYKGARVLEYISAFRHVKDFSRGVLDTRPVVLYLSGIALMLFSTIKVLESRRWL